MNYQGLKGNGEKQTEVNNEELQHVTVPNTTQQNTCK